jgi:hypothetical protein
MTTPFRSSLLSKKVTHANMPPVYKIPLWQLNCQFGMVKHRQSAPIVLKDAVKYERRNQQADVTLLFAIRTAGCGLCREHGLQLTELAAADRKLALLATVKETGVDDQGLLDFYEHYFHSYPIYKDEKWMLYKAMGGKKLGILSVLKAALGSRKRLQEKNIKGSAQNYKNEGWMSGGVLVFDRRGQLSHVLEEQVGKPFDMEELKRAIQEARNANKNLSESSSEVHDDAGKESVGGRGEVR